MTYITFEEFKEILKKSIDETANINEAIEKTVQFIYLKGYADCSRRLWISSAIPPKVSGNYWCTFGGTNLTGKDYYTTESDAKEIFDDAAEEYVGWQSQNVIAWMPLPESYVEREINRLKEEFDEVNDDTKITREDATEIEELEQIKGEADGK